MPENRCEAPGTWEGSVRHLISDTIPNDERGKLDGMFSPTFVSCSEKDLTLTLAFDNEAWMCNLMNNMHGGAIATAFDMAMGTLCVSACGFTAMTPTVSMQLSYLRPVPVGESLIIESRVDHRGRTLVQTSARGYLASAPEKPVVTACGTYYVVK